ncbi:predicted protein [Verticillium alfalfae VaMs.102]|uniref:Predicted protein n=1 Tax=Verticillium alfalfae (strain VaMs.102 / ATCC MYA-4576 / FGSC 10136) TaxID=526221 RepID=C9SS66_VERA1|nr:predicted protein [Verticillium alfalfae VaMs.102]EEY21631.1 predicted protein [Verticillium alfalfae VaMs.102]
MAEIVGLVASSFALAEVVGKIGGGVLKLKRMWDEVKDVPESIQDLFKRLDLILPMVARIARDIETGATVFDDMEAVESCILSCQQVISDEATMMNDLIVQIDATKRMKRARDMVRVALKRDVLERHEKKLEGMIQILMLAHSEYSRACTKAIPTVIVQHLSASGYVAKQRPGDMNEVEEKSVYNLMSPLDPFPCLFNLGSHGTERGFRLQPPWWLTHQAWELRVLSGWQWHFRAYNFVPDDSPVISSVLNGDMNTLLQLFEEGRASPFDVCVRGSLMQEALRTGRLSIVQILVQLGVCISHHELYSAVYGLIVMGYPSHSPSTIDKARRMQIFQEFVDFITTQGFWELQFKTLSFMMLESIAMNNGKAFLEVLLPKVSPNHYNKPFRHRLRSLRHVPCDMKEETFAFLLWPDDGCRQLIIQNSSGTVYRLRDGSYHHWASVPTVRLMTLTLQSWLEDLDESGINLTSYGREELEIIKSTTSDREYQYGPLCLRRLEPDDCMPRVPKATIVDSNSHPPLPHRQPRTRFQRIPPTTTSSPAPQARRPSYLDHNIPPGQSTPPSQAPSPPRAVPEPPRPPAQAQSAQTPPSAFALARAAHADGHASLRAPLACSPAGGTARARAQASGENKKCAWRRGACGPEDDVCGGDGGGGGGGDLSEHVGGLFLPWPCTETPDSERRAGREYRKPPPRADSAESRYTSSGGTPESSVPDVTRALTRSGS